MNDETLWLLEEQFWTGGEDHYLEALDPECVMAFPAPAGILAGPGIIESLQGAPRWSSVAMSDRHLLRPSSDIVVLAYRAEGRREGAPPYQAYCMSGYRHAGEGWRLFQHQQTPF